MNRTDRLFAIHEELRRRGANGTTAKFLADRFEVSSRTIKRDISALQQSGAPIWARPGPGGGYVMEDSTNLPPLNFSASQAVAVAVAVAVRPPGTPFSVDAIAAMKKLNDALASAEMTKAQAASGRIWVDTDRGAKTVARPSVLRAVETAMLEHLAIVIGYTPNDEPATKRVVEPSILAWANDSWYMVGHCRLRNDIRWFRLDRIQEAALTREHYQPRAAAEIGTPPPRARPIHDDQT